MLPGIHAVKVKDIRYARDRNGEIRHTTDGEPAIDIIFINDKNEEIAKLIYYTSESQWIIDALCKAVNVDNSMNEVDVKEIKGKELWIIVAREEVHENGVLAKSADGTDRAYSVCIPKFYPMIDKNSPPLLSGDPAKNNGKPLGVFLKIREIIPQND